MRILLFSIVAICIAGSRSQEIAIATDYLRAHANDSLASEAAINAQIIDLPPTGLGGVLTDSSTTSTDSTTTTLAKKVDDDSPEDADDKNKNPNYDHERKYHLEHDAKITIDVHNILDLFKQQLHETEERILAAVRHSHSSNPAPALKSYRNADR